jgi:hypothetical protein
MAYRLPVTMARAPGVLSLSIESVRVSDLTLGVQGWYGRSEPQQEKFSPPARTGGPKMKPQDGFFTSTIEHGTTHWVEVFSRTLREHEPRSLWEMTPDPRARIAIINSVEDYQRMVSAYPKRWGQGVNSPAVHVNWHELSQASQRIDGVHVSASAAQSHMKPWEVESTLWLRWTFVGWRVVRM